MEENGVKEVLKPDNANVGRGLILVLLAAFLGLFLSIQVVGQTPDVSSETQTAANATTSSVFTSQLTTPTTASPTTVPAAPSVAVPEPSEEVDATSITAKVFNGSRAKGIATKGTSLLNAAGFKTATPGDTPSAVSTSTILYAAGFEDAALAVADLLDSAEELTVEQLSRTNQPVDDVSGLDVIVVVGRDGLIPL